ncbi:377c3e30-b80e-4b4a-8c9c-abf8df5bedd2 [Sclerotinia trifoliorum]|uniref:377c3e30-b80e-4b4a-8c9c-abf8df5bedd2 n=1 Tax=Sclerotinia trifoliorum TaxID=28548 RepID=A0A8H2W089_9HELO|nr:377c3e30-b80e-4b4a-8c9c-abf8df5bedd2 [Sclerotinia trifoliorum]
MSYTDSRGFTNTQRTTIIHRESSPRDSEYSYETRSSDYYTGSHQNMSTRLSSNGHGFGGSGGEQNVKYRDAAADKKYIEGKTSRSGNVHVIAHGDSHKHYDPAEPRASEGKESDYKKTSARYEREKSRPLNNHR